MTLRLLFDADEVEEDIVYLPPETKATLVRKMAEVILLIHRKECEKDDERDNCNVW